MKQYSLNRVIFKSQEGNEYFRGDIPGITTLYLDEKTLLALGAVPVDRNSEETHPTGECKHLGELNSHPQFCQKCGEEFMYVNVGIKSSPKQSNEIELPEKIDVMDWDNDLMEITIKINQIIDYLSANK